MVDFRERKMGRGNKMPVLKSHRPITQSWSFMWRMLFYSPHKQLLSTSNHQISKTSTHQPKVRHVLFIFYFSHDIYWADTINNCQTDIIIQLSNQTYMKLINKQQQQRQEKWPRTTRQALVHTTTTITTPPITGSAQQHNQLHQLLLCPIWIRVKHTPQLTSLQELLKNKLVFCWFNKDN